MSARGASAAIVFSLMAEKKREGSRRVCACARAGARVHRAREWLSWKGAGVRVRACVGVVVEGETSS